MDEEMDYRSAAKSLAALAIVCIEKAWGLSRTVFRRVRPLVAPPDSLRVIADGALYSGVLVIDRNEVILGVVVQTGYDPTSGPAGALARNAAPTSSPSTALDRLRQQQMDTRELFGDPRGRLPSWAETDEDFGGGSWRR